MGLFDMLSTGVITPLYFRLRHPAMSKRLDELEASQYLPPDKLRLIQFATLKRLLIHCDDMVPFYRERFRQCRFDPRQFRELEELRTIPWLTKQEVQKERHRMVASNMAQADLVADASGGSTGEPTSFFKDRRRNELRRADRYRHDMWCGWRPGELYVTLWGGQREFDLQPSLRSRLSDRFLHRTFGFNAFDISEEKVLACLEELRTLRPAMIVAYANVAYLFATVISRHGLDLAGLGLKGVISSAETLTPEKKGAIEEAFCCPVLNRYGSREVGLVASECGAREGLHVNAENVLVELLRADGREAEPGEPGELMVTDLWNYGMPFIRYRMGDVGVREDHPCSCGRGLPLLREVTGRVSDFIVDCRGGLVHGEFFTHLFYGLPGVDQFQLVQETRRLVVLNIRPSAGFQDSLLAPVIGKIRLCLGPQVRVETRLVHGSLVEQSGKFRFTVSKLCGDRYRSFGPLEEEP
ncbi:hypothetical protein L4X63_17295 [Geomonas sp. Red32]|uniref:phenylacetate--CoA ligase family protein n=1 Tax=Geomonas sp. Red32 TaxID=2912856 RepID=UPI00202CAB9B|nr:hypothetical protein [Geomonas sp. Red32]MCM0083344.1 hypothetical protein [Geomonas sp. Red32]